LLELLPQAFRLGASGKLLRGGRLPWLPSKQTLDPLADLHVTRTLQPRPAAAGKRFSGHSGTLAQASVYA
jgi:hypothetical protein